jgi:FKBP-type peptidyl-prolyl cis-trans isomerase
MKKIFKYLFATVFLIQLSSCADPAFSDLDAVLGVTGEKLDKGYSRTGAYEGYSFWTFDGSNLKVEYTLKMNTTIEQQLLDNGRVERAIEEYTIENLKPSFTYDEDRKEVRKGYWGDWGNARFYYGLELSEKGYYIKFEVQWDNPWCNYTHNLSEEDQAEILKRFLITDEADENYIAEKEKLMRKLNEKLVELKAKAPEQYAFLAKKEKEKGIIKRASGLLYEVITPGTGAKPNSANKLKVHYEGSTIDGKVFDSSYIRGEPIEFTLGEVIKGWTEGLKLMSPGAKYKLYIPHDLGYGARGAGTEIPPYSTLIFTVELISFQ